MAAGRRRGENGGLRPADLALRGPLIDPSPVPLRPAALAVAELPGVFRYLAGCGGVVGASVRGRDRAASNDGAHNECRNG
jgi:hypothetical protein